MSKPEEDKDRQESASKKAKGKGIRHKSLCSFLHYFVGIDLAIETKTGRIYEGTLSTADEYMNLTLDNARLKSSSLPENQRRDSSNNFLLTSVHIRGPTIRYIHFDNLDLPAVIRLGIDRETSAAQKYSRGKRNVRSITTGAPAKPST